MEKFLTEIPVDLPCKIAKINTNDRELLTRFYNFGIVGGQDICVLKKSPKNKTLLVSVCGFALALDNSVAQKVIVHE